MKSGAFVVKANPPPVKKPTEDPSIFMTESPFTSLVAFPPKAASAVPPPVTPRTKPETLFFGSAFVLIKRLVSPVITESALPPSATAVPPVVTAKAFECPERLIDTFPSTVDFVSPGIE